MSWSKLAPIAKTTGRPMASASIVVNKDGTAKVVVILSATIFEEFGERPRADVSAGEGEHEGALLVEFAAKGAFEVKRFAKGGGRLFVPIGPGVPDKPAANEPCVLGEKTKDSLVLTLPVATWERDIAARLAASQRRSPQIEESVQARAGTTAPKGLDMVEYLKGKGVKVERLAGERFQLNGETVGAGSVLRVVNEHRKGADLDPLSLAQVR